MSKQTNKQTGKQNIKEKKKVNDQGSRNALYIWKKLPYSGIKKTTKDKASKKMKRRVSRSRSHTLICRIRWRLFFTGKVNFGTWGEIMEIFYIIEPHSVCFFNTCSFLFWTSTATSKTPRINRTNQPTNDLLLFKRFNGRSLCLSLHWALVFFHLSFLYFI